MRRQRLLQRVRYDRNSQPHDRSRFRANPGVGLDLSQPPQSAPGLTVTAGAIGMTIEGLTIQNFTNTSAVVTQNGASVTLDGDTIEHNTNSGGNGGGTDNEGTLTITGGTISRNTASQNGGGVSNNGNDILNQRGDQLRQRHNDETRGRDDDGRLVASRNQGCQYVADPGAERANPFGLAHGRARNEESAQLVQGQPSISKSQTHAAPASLQPPDKSCPLPSRASVAVACRTCSCA